MARDGSGNYSRVEGPYVNGIVADADEVNNELDDIADALSDSINIAGTKAMAANLAMGGFKVTGLAAGASNGDAVRYEQLASYQPLDADLTAIAALGYTSGTYIISKTAADAWALNSISANGLSLVGGADYAAMRTLLSVQPLAANLTTYASKTPPSGDVVGTSDSQTLTNKTLTSPTINGGTAQLRTQLSSETSGTLTSASANKRVKATAGVTINDGVFTAEDAVEIYNDSDSSITITQDTGMTLRLAGTTSTGNRTLEARGIAYVYFDTNADAAVGGSGVT